VTCAWNVPDTKEQAFSHYSNKEYQSKIGLQTALEKRRKWISDAGLTETLNNLPSAKTSSSAQMERHIRAVYQILDKILELNGKRRVRGLRFGQYVRRQKVMHDICTRIIANPDKSDTRKVVVAFGAGMFSSSSKGHAPGPVKGIRKALRRKNVEIYDVNEDYTSQLCHCCYEKLVPMYSEGGEEGEGEAIHGVRRCLTTECVRKTLNRDINAAINILYVFEEETSTGVKPEKFTRTFQMKKPDMPSTTRTRPMEKCLERDTQSHIDS
jgi:Putative transposase DNA-binding domain